jgi:hypothetical protein
MSSITPYAVFAKCFSANKLQYELNVESPTKLYRSYFPKEQIMKRYVFTAIAVFSMFSATQAKEIGYCESSFDLSLIPGDKVVCQKKAKEWAFHSNRLCPPLMTYRPGKEADDGGDMCTGAGGVVDVPAAPCGIGERMVLKRNERDVCQKEREVTKYGDIKTRLE